MYAVYTVQYINCMSASVHAWWACVSYLLSASVLVTATISKGLWLILHFPAGCDWRRGRCSSYKKGWKSFWQQNISQIATLLRCQSATSVFTAQQQSLLPPTHPITSASTLLWRYSKAWCMSLMGKANVTVNGVDTSLNGSWLCCCMSSAGRLLRLVLKQ